MSDERMKWALEDIENYVNGLDVSAAGIRTLIETLLDVPGAEDGIKAAESMLVVYETIAKELRRHTNRGLNRDA